MSTRKTTAWIPALRVTCRKVEKNGKPPSVIRRRCFQAGRGEIWLFDTYSFTNDNKKEKLRTRLTLTRRHLISSFCGVGGEGKSRWQQTVSASTWYITYSNVHVVSANRTANNLAYLYCSTWCTNKSGTPLQHIFLQTIFILLFSRNPSIESNFPGSGNPGRITAID